MYSDDETKQRDEMNNEEGLMFLVSMSPHGIMIGFPKEVCDYNILAGTADMKMDWESFAEFLEMVSMGIGNLPTETGLSEQLYEAFKRGMRSNGRQRLNETGTDNTGEDKRHSRRF